MIFAYFGFDISSKKGSHIKLVRNKDGVRQILTILNHKEIDKGTLRAIIRQASVYIKDDELYKYFYNLIPFTLNIL